MDQVAPVITEMAKGLRRSGDASVRLVVRLHPQELGSVTVALRSTARGVEVTLRTSGNESAAALVTQEHKIREVLANNGLDLGGFNVRMDSSTSTGSQGGFSYSAAQSDSGSSESGGQHRAPAQQQDADINDARVPVAAGRRTSSTYL